MHTLIRWSLVLSLAGWSAEGAESEPDAAPPFVISYERFVRPGDLPASTGGSLLWSELACGACHLSSTPGSEPKSGPRLDNAGLRLQQDWLQRYLTDPSAVQSGTTMPDVLTGLTAPARADTVRALVAFLTTQRAPFEEPKASGANPVPHEFWNQGRVERGRELYHQVGCVACHEPDSEYVGGSREASALDRLIEQLEPEELAELGLSATLRTVPSIPHGELAAKYSPESLTHFLLAPAEVRGGRMPNLKLSAMEAADLAAYLLRNGSPQRAASSPDVSAFVERGRKLFGELHCQRCHSAGFPSPPANDLPARDQLRAGAGCLGPPRAGVPRYALDTSQREALAATLQAAPDRLRPPATATSDPAQFSLLQHNCFACHARAGLGGVGHARQRYFETVGQADLGDEGRLPPPLDGVGRKLRPAWIQKVLTGTGDIRPYLRVRMPRFAESAMRGLPQLFGRADEPDERTEQQVFGDRAGLAEAGRTLLDAGCVQCHPTRGESLPSVLGVDLAGVTSRVHPAWFQRFLLDPGQWKPRTRMPTFFPQGQSSNRDVLDGHVERQIAALWTYLREIDSQPLPDKVLQARSRDFELIPTNRPIILRTFMNEAGTHAIAVGFPAGVHLAWDAERAGPAIAWRGRFLDAHGTWFDRFAPPAMPLGESIATFPPRPAVALFSNGETAWPTAQPPSTPAITDPALFLGYRLDRAGI
ncbi:MAG: cytochrome c family protein, partial [Pirellulaceae bacterium]